MEFIKLRRALIDSHAEESAARSFRRFLPRESKVIPSGTRRRDAFMV